jgi:heme/copper-type cytochrome/quinol oxidase subunit 4
LLQGGLTVELQKKAAWRKGNIVLVVLAVLTLVEFAVAIYVPSAVLLFIIALLKAAIILQAFMHVYRLWREEDH